jgi:hypothetical protein
MSKIGNTLKTWIKSKRFWKRFAVVAIGLPVILFFTLVLIVYVKQDDIVQDLIADLNKDFRGATELKDSHISMFENFPYISIDLEEFKVFETKEKSGEPLIQMDDVYVGFNLWTILTGKMDVKKIKLVNGSIDLVQNIEGEFNIVNALTTETEIESPEEEFHLDLKRIELENVDISKLNEANGLKVEAFIKTANAKFETSPKHVLAACETEFVMNIIKENDTTFFKNKEVQLDTQLDFLKEENSITLSPSVVQFGGSEFNAEGSIDFDDDVYLDLKFSGDKPNFDLLVALAPEDLMPTLEQYENEAQISFNSKIKGKSVNGHSPQVTANFSCKNGYIINPKTNKKIDGINFKATFSNGKNQHLSTMVATLENFTARPKGGSLAGNIKISDFTAPLVHLDLASKFDLGFVSKFLNIDHLQKVSGKGEVNIEFDDIIDLDNPELAIAELDQSYKMKFALRNARFESDQMDLPVKKLNLLADVNGKKVSVKITDLNYGKSDLNLTASVDDLPAIIHHSDKEVDTRLSITSEYLDIYEITGGKEKNGFDEQIEELQMDFDFKASARAFTESKHLPQGEFFIENLYAKLKHYPHTLHDFHADIFVEEEDLRIVDFSGMIDKSDFTFTGMVEHYEKWLNNKTDGDSKIEFDLVSNMLQLESLFSYQGENYVPEEYRHEQFDDLKLHGFVYLHYDDALKSVDLNLDRFDGKMKVHPLKLQNFKGRVHYEDDHLVVEDFQGKLGKSSFKTTLHYYLGKNDKIRKRDNHFSVDASYLDIDQLIKYNPAPAIKNNKAERTGSPKVDHNSGFNIYELPFTDMTFDLKIDHLNYHRYLIHNMEGSLRTTPDHYLYVDNLHMDASGGHFKIDGYFNGSNPDEIYFHPTINATNIDLDKLLFKFENFGQDYIVAENLHGRFTGEITGKVLMYPDMTPKIDQSEVHMDIDVTNGSLERFEMLSYLSDYFSDKNLSKVLFDTLQNSLDLVDGVMTIPKMTINSSLGHMEISGKQDMNGNMEYYLSIPWKMVTRAASSKLFGRKKEEVPEDQTDEIQYGTEKQRYVNVIITGDENGYKFRLGKPKRRG